MSVHDRFAVFIDGHHLHALQRSLGFRVDFKRMLEVFRERGELVRVYYFSVLDNAEEQNSVVRLLDWLEYNGHTVVRVNPRDSLSTEMAVIAMDLVVERQLGEMAFIVGASEFRSLIETLRRRGVRTTVISTLTGTPVVNDGLRRTADQFVEMADIRQSIEMQQS